MDEAIIIDRMRARYQAELVESENRTKAIRAKLQVLDELSTEKEQLALSTGMAATPKAKAANDSFAPKQDRLPRSVTDACLWVVARHGTDAPLAPKQVRVILLQNGFIPKSANFPSIVMNTLKRLALAGKVKLEKRDKNLFFSP